MSLAFVFRFLLSAVSAATCVKSKFCLQISLPYDSLEELASGASPYTRSINILSETRHNVLQRTRKLKLHQPFGPSRYRYLIFKYPSEARTLPCHAPTGGLLASDRSSFLIGESFCVNFLNYQRVSCLESDSAVTSIHQEMLFQGDLDGEPSTLA